MNKFEKAYLNILYESSGIIPFNIDDYKNFLKTSIKFDNNNLVKEDKELLIDVPNSLIDYLLMHKNELIKGDSFKFLLNESKHWNNLRNIQFNELFFALFNFNDEKEIDKFHYHCFNIDKEDLINVRNDFIENCGGLFGFYNSYQNKDILCINSKSTNIFLTIYHELSHFIQNKGNIRIVNGITLNQIKHKDKLITLFNIDYDKVISYFSDIEFVPHVDDFIYMLKRTKNEYYKNIKNEEFLEELRNFLLVKNRNEMLNHSFLLNFKNANNGNYDTLAMFLFSYVSKYKFQKIFNIIKMHFK